MMKSLALQALCVLFFVTIQAHAQSQTQAQAREPKAQAAALYHWVSQEIRYVAIFLGSGGVVPNPADRVIRNRYGDCKDKTTLLIA